MRGGSNALRPEVAAGGRQSGIRDKERKEDEGVERAA